MTLELFLDTLTACFQVFEIKVYLPYGPFLLVLPIKVKSKLLLPLCHTWVESCRALCIHSDEEGTLTGTWYSLELLELKKSLKKGCKIYGVWHFHQWVEVVPEIIWNYTSSRSRNLQATQPNKQMMTKRLICCRITAERKCVLNIF